jgi:hypothetical protein
MEAHNATAGQGPVLLDIGGDIGALIVAMPAALDGIEIEIRPVGEPAHDRHGHAHGVDHDDHHHDDHHHDDLHHDDDHHHTHAGSEPHLQHVAVVARPAGSTMVHSAVFAGLSEGVYELYERLGGTVQLRATVHGGAVTEAAWPSLADQSVARLVD